MASFVARRRPFKETTGTLFGATIVDPRAPLDSDVKLDILFHPKYGGNATRISQDIADHFGLAVSDQLTLIFVGRTGKRFDITVVIGDIVESYPEDEDTPLIDFIWVGGEELKKFFNYSDDDPGETVRKLTLDVREEIQTLGKGCYDPNDSALPVA